MLFRDETHRNMDTTHYRLWARWTYLRWERWAMHYGHDGLCGCWTKSYVLAAYNGDNLPEQLRIQRQAYCADCMAFVDTLMDIGDS